MKLWVQGIVAARNKQPYIVLSQDDKTIGQLTMAEATNFAHDILVMCARTEADAMIHKFFDKQEFPEQAGAALMKEFRDFRADLDEGKE